MQISVEKLRWKNICTRKTTVVNETITGKMFMWVIRMCNCIQHCILHKCRRIATVMAYSLEWPLLWLPSTISQKLEPEIFKTKSDRVTIFPRHHMLAVETFKSGDYGTGVPRGKFNHVVSDVVEKKYDASTWRRRRRRRKQMKKVDELSTKIRVIYLQQ